MNNFNRSGFYLDWQNMAKIKEVPIADVIQMSDNRTIKLSNIPSLTKGIAFAWTATPFSEKLQGSVYSKDDYSLPGITWRCCVDLKALDCKAC